MFDKERTLRYVGCIDDSERAELAKTRELRDALDALLAGREIEVKEVNHTKVFGCSVKWAGKEQAVKDYVGKLAAEPVSVELVHASGLTALRKNNSSKMLLVNYLSQVMGARMLCASFNTWLEFLQTK